jgi:leucine dehydrogenase
MSVFSSPSFDEHEQVCFASDRRSGLRAIIAVHDSTLGPAVGGCRMYPYDDDACALEDVLRLSRGMTYKSALAGLPFGGGKSVIIGDPACDKNTALMHAMGDFIESLGGRYVAAEDSGTSVEDLREMAQRTRHVSGIALTEAGGDPSPYTALGVFIAMRRALQYRLGSDDLDGIRVAVQGLGHVGFHLASALRAEGALVFGADVNAENLARAEHELGVTPVASDEILALDVDVLAPCALGGVLNSQSVACVRAGVIAGAANNQLATEEDGARLQDRGILYCPDFLINAGGIIDVHYQRSGGDRARLKPHIAAIGDRLQTVLERADRLQQPTQKIAEGLARELLDEAARPPVPQLASAG